MSEDLLDPNGEIVVVETIPQRGPKSRVTATADGTEDVSTTVSSGFRME